MSNNCYYNLNCAAVFSIYLSQQNPLTYFLDWVKNLWTNGLEVIRTEAVTIRDLIIPYFAGQDWLLLSVGCLPSLHDHSGMPPWELSSQSWEIEQINDNCTLAKNWLKYHLHEHALSDYHSFVPHALHWVETNMSTFVCMSGLASAFSNTSTTWRWPSILAAIRAVWPPCTKADRKALELDHR